MSFIDDAELLEFLDAEFPPEVVPKKQKCSSESTSESSREDDRLQFLIDMPKLVLEAFNAGNLKKMKRLLTQSCAPTCALRTPALLEEQIGVDKIFDMLRGALAVHPDSICVVTNSQLEEGCVVASFVFSGTKQFSDEAEQLFNTFKFGLHLDKENEEIGKKIEDEGGSVVKSGRGTIRLILSGDMRWVEKMIWEWRINDVREAAPV